MPRHTISLVETGASVPCIEPRSLLEAILAGGGYGLKVGCRNGGCGVCKVRVLAGQYRRRPMSRRHVSLEEEHAGVALACCVFPTSDLQVTVAPPDTGAATGATLGSDKAYRAKTSIY
jgi:ferredoxin